MFITLKNDVAPSNMVEGKDDVIKQHEIVSHITAQWIVAE